VPADPHLDASPSPYLAAVDAVTGTPTAWQPRPDGDITTLVIANGILSVDGSFNRIDNAARHGLAAVDLATGALLPWDPGADSNNQSISTLTAFGSTVYVGGSFDRIGMAQHHDIAALHATTGAARAGEERRSSPGAGCT
jgi:hypothetical protein